MKKRLLALLLAGLMTASLASCTTRSGKNPTPSGTEEEQTVVNTPNQGNNNNNNNNNNPTVTWTDVDETVYVTATNGMTLTGVEDGASLKVDMLDELHRVKVSNSSRSIVEKDGKQYYADSAKLTAEDILGKGFTKFEKKMYATTNLTIRAYASTKAPEKGGLELNEEVNVVAKGDVGDMNWSKIKIDGKYYFVSSKYLSEEKAKDPNKTDYSALFTDCTPVVKYVTATTLTLRKNANTSADALAYLKTDTEVTVIATGVVDGINWSKVKIADEVKPGDTPTYTIGYVGSAHLSPVKGGTELTLDDMLALYPAFEKKAPAQVMYVAADSLNARTSPEFPADNANLIINLSLKKKTQVTVVASGKVEDTAWAMIEYKDGEKTKYAFVSEKWLTTDPDGNMIVTLDSLIEKYGMTKLETSKTMYALQTVSCKTAPDNKANADKTLEANQKVTVYATVEKDGATWCLFQVEGSDVYYFAGETLFTESVG